MKIQNTLVLNIRGRSQQYFAHVTTVSLSWRVQNIVVIGRVYSKLEHSEFSSNFEFDRNMLSGTGARPFVRGIHWSPVNSLTMASDAELCCFSLICAWIKGWVNTREAGDLGRHRAHYYVTVMLKGVGKGVHLTPICKWWVNSLFATTKDIS